MMIEKKSSENRIKVDSVTMDWVILTSVAGLFCNIFETREGAGEGILMVSVSVFLCT